MLSQNVDDILSSPFRRRFAELFQGLKETDKIVLSSWLIFILRRLFFCLVAFELYIFP
jgi:hypothetical protein